MSDGKEWLKERFGTLVDINFNYLPELQIDRTGPVYLDESILDKFDYHNHDALDYLVNKRHLDERVIEEFKIGFDIQTKCVTFPAWSSNGKLVGIFKRSIYDKRFIIPDQL